MELVVFIVASLMVLVGAVGVIVRSHPVHAALSLILFVLLFMPTPWAQY